MIAKDAQYIKDTTLLWCVHDRARTLPLQLQLYLQDNPLRRLCPAPWLRFDQPPHPAVKASIDKVVNGIARILL